MGLEIISYRSPELRNLVSAEIKQYPSLSIRKDKMKTWHCDN